MNNRICEITYGQKTQVIVALAEATGGYEMLMLCRSEPLTDSQVQGMKNIVKKLREACDMLMDTPVKDEQMDRNHHRQQADLARKSYDRFLSKSSSEEEDPF